MENIDSKYAIKHVYGPIVLVLNIFATLMLIRLFLLSLNVNLFPPLTIMLIIYLSLEVVFWFKFMNIQKKTAELCLSTHSLRLYDLQLTPNQIDKIIIMGYFNQKVGIRIANKRVITSSLSFRMHRDEDDVIKDIMNWSKRNGVKVEKGYFSIWF